MLTSVGMVLVSASCGGGNGREDILFLYSPTADSLNTGDPEAWVQPEDFHASSGADVRQGPTPDVAVDPPLAGPCCVLQTAESLDDLSASYVPGNWQNVLLQIVDRRYDPGHYIMLHVEDQAQLSNWVQTGDFQALSMSASTAVHELNHMFGWELGGWSDYAFFLCPGLVIKVANADTPARSVVYDLLDPAVGNLVMSYADLYLTGMMGSQGFWTLLDELNAYTHSIFVDYQLLDRLPMGYSISSLDGLLTFMLFAELYLKWVRENEPAKYDSVIATPTVKDLVLTLFERAEWIIDETSPQKHRLSLDADGILDRVFDTAQYAEIEMLRD